MAALGLCCCALCGKQGLLFTAGLKLLTAVASLVEEHGLQVLGLQELQHVGSAVVIHGFSCPTDVGFSPGQGWSPYPLHWQTDS